MVRDIVLFPPHRLWPAWTGHAPAADEDRELPYRLLAARGIVTTRIDPGTRPWNPASQSHTLLRAIDPLRALQVMLFRRRTRVVLCFFEPAALVLVLLRRVLAFRGRVVVIDVGGNDGWRLRRMIQDLVLPRVDAVRPYSESQVGEIQALWPGARRVRAVRAVVDCGFFAAAADQPQGPVLSIGDDKSRDYPTFLAAVHGLDHPVVLRTRRAPADLDRAIQVVATELDVPAYRDLIAGSCIVVLPLHPVLNAGGVSVLIQAMASGKAVVLSASPGLAEYVQDGVDALVVPPDDPAALRHAIDRLLTDPALRRRIGTAARQTAERTLSLEAWADRIAEMVNEL